MTCRHCGRALDAQALELGACRYCGHAFPEPPPVPRDAPTIDSLNPLGPPNPLTKSQYGWTDWPPSNPNPAMDTPTENATPMDPAFDPPTLDSIWRVTDNNAPTEFATVPGAPPDPFAPPVNAAPVAPLPRSTAPFAINMPPVNAAPPDPYALPINSAPPHVTPQLPPSAPPVWRQTTPRPTGSGKRLALASIGVVLLLAIIGGGLLVVLNLHPFTHGVATNHPTATLAAGTSPTARPAATPTATAIPTDLYHDSSGLFSIRYPSAWDQERFSPKGVPFPLPLSGVSFGSGPAEFDIVTGQEAPLMPTNGLAGQADDTILSTMSARNVSGAKSVKIGGKTWTEKSADTSGGKHTIIASISYNHHIYSLWYSAPSSAFSTDQQQFFNPMVASFSFGG